MVKEIQCKVKGMTCASCEVIIERALKKEEGIHRIDINRFTETAIIECDDTITLDHLNNTLQEKGYSFSSAHEEPFNNDLPEPDSIKINKKVIEVTGALIIIGALYIILTQFNLVPDIGVTDGMSYGIVFAIGIIAAMSTCLAVAGGLLLALAAKFNEAHPHLTGWAKFRPHAYFNIGRIAGYALFGATIGLIGSVFTLSTWMTGLITILASLLMILVGLQLLQLFPWLNKIPLKMPKRFAHKLYDASNTQGPSRKKAAVFGALTFFLPCGFTQALQLYVLAQGSALTGFLTMLVFSLGTAPALVSIGALSSFTKGSLQRYFTTFAAVLVIILGIMNVPYGLSLTGLATGGPTENAQFATENVGVQVVHMNVDGLDYAPHQFTLKQGVPVEWIIDGTSASGCSQVITAPKLGITERLKTNGPTTIKFTPTETGFVPFSCMMGMTTRGAGFNIVAA